MHNPIRHISLYIIVATVRMHTVLFLVILQREDLYLDLSYRCSMHTKALFEYVRIKSCLDLVQNLFLVVGCGL